MGRVLAVDGDETLWECNPHFRAVDELCAEMVASDVRSAGLSSADIRQRHRQVHVGIIRRHGFFLDMHRMSWLETYRQVCAQTGCPPAPGLAEQLAALATEPLRAPYRLFPGVADALKQLRAAGHRLHLVTTGDRAFQRLKAARNGIAHHFVTIHVVRYGKQGVFRKLAGRDPGLMVVGDSINRDIRPAQRLNIPSVWISSLEERARHSNRPSGNGFHVLQNFSELPPIIGYL